MLVDTAEGTNHELNPILRVGLLDASVASNKDAWVLEHDGPKNIISSSFSQTQIPLSFSNSRKNSNSNMGPKSRYRNLKSAQGRASYASMDKTNEFLDKRIPPPNSAVRRKSATRTNPSPFSRNSSQQFQRSQPEAPLSSTASAKRAGTNCRNSKKSLYEKSMNKKFIAALLDMENGFRTGSIKDIAKDLRAATAKRRNSNKSACYSVKAAK